MAAASALVSEDSLLCPVCLSVFIKPVSIPCGHNFCLDCITACWHTLSVLQCPLCKEKFHTRPLLRVNTIIAEMAEKVKSVQEMILSSAERAGNEDVLCSICVGAKVKALKSCLMCLVSYCQTHLEPHQRILALKKHKLIDPVKNLESRICRDHGEPLELICRLDQMFLCQSCKCSDHKTHETVALEDEAEMRKTQLRLENNSMDQFIQEHEQKIQELQQSVKTSRSKAEEALLYSRKVMTALVQHIKTEFTRLSEAIEMKQKINETEAESFINELEAEITHIKKKKLQFHEALLIRDPFRFLENVLPLTYNKPQLKDWSAVTVTSDQFMIQETMTELETAVREEVSTLCDINFRDGKQQRNNLEDLTYVKEYQPNVSGIKHLRVLIYGPVGSGKSSFINSVSSVLRRRISVPALTSTSDRNFTIKYETYKIRKGRGSSATVYPVVFNDTMGLEEGVNCGIHPDDIKLAMQGHVKDGYKFNPIAPLSERDPAYNPTPTADDKVHVLVCVLSGNASEIKLSVLEKMNRVQQLARYLGKEVPT